MPYYLLLSKRARSISFHDAINGASDEFEYMNDFAETYQNSGLIDFA
jgi:hypothetical protein